MASNLLNPHSKMEGEYEPIPAEGDKDWLRLSKDAYEESEQFLDAALRSQWERNLANFQSRHPEGSKYHLPAYKFRSRGFRPKTRAMVMNNEAAVSAAYFSTQDVTQIQSENQGDPLQNASARLINELVNYRLTNSVPWFMTLLGAAQDTMKYGVCISHQHWNYEEREREIRIVELVDGEPVERQETTIDVVTDAPAIELRPPENIRISPSASWLDPINTSPYLIDIMPMYLQDVRAMTKAPQGVNSRVKWRQLKDQELRVGHKNESDSTRRANQGGRPDPKDGYFTQARDHELVWVHRYIAKRDGRDWLWYTVDTEVMLSDPAPLERVYPHLRKNQRPYVMGVGVVDTHKTHPPALSELVQNLQAEANDIANQRRDNVKLAMNKRYAVKTGDDRTDMSALTRSIPGGVVYTSNPNENIREFDTKDVTASAYQEQDRINVDFDELAGEFSVSSVQSNRSLNETVGGMQLMQAGSSQVKEYRIKIFSETWVRPVIRQLAWMEATYETDETIIQLAGEKAQLEAVPEELFTEAGDMAVNINVGMGSTNPQQRIERFSLGLNSLASVFPDLPLILNKEEVIGEVFGALGYQDGQRFFNLDQPPPPDPQQQQAEQDMALESARLEQEMQLEQQQLAQEAQIEGQRLAQESDIELQRLAQELAIERERLAMEEQEMQLKLDLARRQAAMKASVDSERNQQQKVSNNE